MVKERRWLLCHPGLELSFRQLLLKPRLGWRVAGRWILTGGTYRELIRQVSYIVHAHNETFN